MKKSRITVIVTLLSTLLAIPVAYAAINLKKKPAATITHNANDTVTVEGVLTGLGDASTEDIEVEVTASGIATLTCSTPNPKQNKPPGQNKVPIDTTGTITANPDEITENGNFPFEVTTEEPTLGGGCKGGGLVEDSSVSYTSATINVLEGGTIIETFNCTFAATSPGVTRTMNCN